MKNNELAELCGKVRDGILSDEDLHRLEAELESNPDSRRYYLEFFQVDSFLESFPPIEDTGADSGRSRNVPVPTTISSTWIATAAAVIVLLVGIIVWQGQEQKGVANMTPSIGTLILSDSCIWNSKALVEGQRLPEGVIELDSGTAVIRFDGGAEAVLTGPAGFKLESAISASLVHGEVVIRAVEGAEGFVLGTPSGRLIDLGTEFAVRVDETGETELHVHEGEVAVDTDSAKPEEIVEAGAAVRIGAEPDHSLQSVILTAPRFQDLLARAAPKERRDLMTVYEGFHVDPGVYYPYQLDTGKGWAAPWRKRREEELNNHHLEAARRMKIAHSQMDITWPIKGGRAGMLKMSPGPEIWIRKMTKPMRMDRWGIYYFSFLVTQPFPSETKETLPQGRGDVRFTFRSSKNYFDESLSLGWDKSQRPRVATSDWKTVRSIREVPSGGTIFCVAKIDTRKRGTDQILFRIYTAEDELDLVEPAEWDVILSGFSHSALYDLIVLTSNSRETRFVDEIRLGPSWRSVTPVDHPLYLMSGIE
ncbi:MAG: hypothetical protein AAGC68_03415 [Verrucomicrobiota bacterium]